MGTGTTYSSDLDRLGKHMFGADWRGIYASDDTLPSNGCYIVNTDKKSGPGEPNADFLVRTEIESYIGILCENSLFFIGICMSQLRLQFYSSLL